MRRIALAALGALLLNAGVSGVTPAAASDYGYDDGEGYGVSETVVTRRTVVERPVVVQPRTIVREVIVDRPVVVRPRPVVREVVIERPVVFRPRREAFYEEDHAYRPRRFGPRRAGYGIGPGFNPYD